MLHLVDGFRLNNAFFRNAPNQYMALVDGQALPAALHPRELPGGITAMVRMLGGYFKPDAFDAAGVAHYELALFTITALPDGSSRDSETYFDEGTAERLALRQALLKLSAGQRAVLVLRFYEDRTEAETAQLLGCAIGTVKSQTARALARLRKIAPDLLELPGSEGAS